MINIGDHVEKVGGDYSYRGLVVSVFNKLARDAADGQPILGPIRVVVQNADGMLFIFNPSQLQIVP